MSRTMFVAAVSALLGASLGAQAPSITTANSSGWKPASDRLTMPIWPGVPPGSTPNLPPEINVNPNGPRAIMEWPQLAEKWLRTIKVLPAD